MRDLLIVGCAAALGVSAANAGVLFVDADANALEDGTSWTNAYTDLRDALGAALPGDEIWVVQGTYLPGDLASPPSATFLLPADVQVLGGFVGVETMASQRDPQVHETILSGDVGVPGNPFDNSHFVVTCDNIGIGTVLDGFTVTLAQGASSGGILISDSSPRIERCRFVDNVADSGGALLVNRALSSPVFSHCRFESNQANANGGAALIAGQANASFVECVFASNEAVGQGGAVWLIESSSASFEATTLLSNEAGFVGGAISATSTSAVDLTDCVLQANSAADEGGAIFCTQSALHGTDTVFVGNSTSVALGGGGAVRQFGGTSNWMQCRFDTNTTAADGGAMNLSGAGSLTNLYDCVFTGNISGGNGGAVVNRSGASLAIANTVFHGNAAAGTGGAVESVDASSLVTLGNCTVFDNTASLGGSALSVDAVAQMVVRNSILSQNAPQQLSGVGLGIEYCMVTGGLPGIGNIDAVPLFVDASSGNLRLRGCSPGIDAGSNAEVPVGLVSDIEGLPRFVDDPESADTGTGLAPIVDMGAYEYQALPCPADLSGNCSVGLEDLALVLGGFGCAQNNCLGDVDGDGDADLADLASVLSVFGSACP